MLNDVVDNISFQAFLSIAFAESTNDYTLRKCLLLYHEMAPLWMTVDLGVRSNENPITNSL